MSLFDASFFKRLGYYLFGLSIGIVFLALFFKKKTDETDTEFCYFPNCRVLKDLRSKPLNLKKSKVVVSNQELDTTAIKAIFTHGDVLFDRSDTKSEPCKRYFVEGEINSKSIILEVENCPKEVILVSIEQ